MRLVRLRVCYILLYVEFTDFVAHGYILHDLVVVDWLLRAVTLVTRVCARTRFANFGLRVG